MMALKIDQDSLERGFLLLRPLAATNMTSPA
jgi:hypothetical protein